MKCSECNGTGIDDDRLTCYKCCGTGEVEQTNEEWFDTLSTKEKAEVIAQLSSYGGNVKAIFDWLKKKHRKEK